MKRVSTRVSRSISQSGSKKSVAVRISNGKKMATRRASIKTK